MAKIKMIKESPRTRKARLKRESDSTRRIELHKLELFIREELNTADARADKLRFLRATVIKLQKEME